MTSAGGLSVQDLTVKFGGLTAISAVTLDVPRGSLVGLIGPNGAGKTTTFNACSGLVSPTAGTVWLDGRDMTQRSPHRRAQAGLGRTFQKIDLFDRLSVEDNVRLGYEARLASAHPWSKFTSTPSEGRAVRQRAHAALARCGVAHLAPLRAGSLSTGHRRLVELARAIAGAFAILLLDEPSSGLDHDETSNFAQILTTLVQEDGTGILLVEHDMNLVREVCERLYVLDFGSLIATGPTSDVLDSAEVRAAYLGRTVA